jgi:MFS family permease
MTVGSQRLLVLLCVTMCVSTVSIGAFPALLPEVAGGRGLADWQLGAVAGAFGFARMLADVPVGVFITHHARRALLFAPFILVAGIACVVMSASFGMLLLGRALMGAGHTLGMLAGLTAILRYRAGAGLASALNAFEFSAMIGILGGVGVLTLLPRGLSWETALLVACVPLVIAFVTAPLAAAALPRAEAPPGTLAASRGSADTTGSAALSGSTGWASMAVLAFAAGGTVALAYSTVEQFVIPLRGSREFALDRAGIARTLMIAQATDLLALLPVGALADRRGTAPVLGTILVVFAAAMALIAFGATLPMLQAGCVLFGLSMAGWMLPLGVLRAVTPSPRVAWRLSLYRVVVDGGMFLGPFLSGLLATRYPRLLPALLAAALGAIGLALTLTARPATRRTAFTPGPDAP